MLSLACSRPFARIVGALLFAAGLLQFSCSLANAQLPQARLYALHPLGGQRGTTVDVTLSGGTDLDDADRLYFSHPGITAAPKTQTVDGKLQPVAGQFTVTVGPDVPVGVYDIRAHSRYGLSNPRTFSVGDRKEVLETEPNNAPEQALAVELNTVINGKSDGAADLDWYKLSLKAGQRVLVTLKSRRIDSRMEGALELHHGGRRIAHEAFRGRSEPLLDFTPTADGEYFVRVHDFVYGGGAEYGYRLTVQTGPHIDYILPASGVPNATGEFTIYGRNLPGGQPAALKAADGRELEQLKLQIATVADPAALLPGEQVSPEESGVDGVPFTLSSPSGSSNPITIYFASAPTTIEKEPNDAADKAQKLSLPVEVTGQFQARGDIDVYEFEAKAASVYWVEVFGERSGSAADPVLVIDQVKKNEKGEESLTRITALDDNATNIGGNHFNTVTDDPVFRFAVPADGAYRVTVRDRAFENRGDLSLIYRLAIRRETPDFRLVVLPTFPTTDPAQLLNTWDLNLRKGDNADVSVMAFRRDGFSGPIDVTVEGLPQGVTCAGATIAASQNLAHVVFVSTEQAADWFGRIRIVGRARVDDPAAQAAETAAFAARTAAAGALPGLDKAVADTSAALRTAIDQTSAAKAALDKEPTNEALKKAKADADAGLAKAEAAAKAAVDAKAAGDKKLAESVAAVAAARGASDVAAREIVHEARGATIVWNGNQATQQAAQARLARSITLSVVKESAPYQLVTDVARVSVNQGSQLLIPFKLLKRGGFDNNVTMTFITPPQNVQVENKPINKGVADQVHRVYVQNNAPPGVYTLFVQSNTQVSYSRNPEAAALAAKEKEAADKLAAEAAEAAKKATENKAAADKKAADAEALAKKAPEVNAAADKLAVETAAAAKAAADEKAKLDKASSDTATAAKVASDEQARAEKLAADAAATVNVVTEERVKFEKAAAAAATAVLSAVDEKLKADMSAAKSAVAAKESAEAAAKAKDALGKDANNEALKKAASDADAAAVAAANEAKKSAEAKAAADNKVIEAAIASKKAADEKAAGDKKVADAVDAAKKAADARSVAEKKAVDAAEIAKKIAEAKAAAEKKAVETADAAKKAADAKAAADKTVADSPAAVKQAAEEKAAAEKLAAETDQKSKAAAAIKAAADKKATDTANVAKPQNINAFFPAAAIVVEVKPAPGTLALNVPGGGAVKRGANLEVKVTVNRANGFTGPVKLTLPLPPGVTGLSAPEVTIPADKNEGVLVIQAAAEATMGQLANLVVRAAMDYDGPASIDQPIAINVQQ